MARPEPPKPRKPRDKKTPKTPVAPPPYKPLPKKRTYGTYKKTWEQDSGAGGTYGRPATSRTTITLYDAKTGKKVSSRTKVKTLKYKGGRYAE